MEQTRLRNVNALTARYSERIDSAAETLLADIALWSAPEMQESLAANDPNGMMLHHIQQFQYFAVSALELFDEQSRYSTYSSEQADFRALVVGMLSTRWSLLRQATIQRVGGSPYGKRICELDKKASTYYFRLRNALGNMAGAEKAKSMRPFAPRVFLGRVANITIYNRTVPLVLGVPVGAAFQPMGQDDHINPSELAMAHEIGHAFLLQLPGVLTDVQRQLEDQWNISLAAQSQLHRSQALRRMMVGWCEEVLADMIGTALAGPEFVESALSVMATPEGEIGLTDGVHPPAPVRPFIHIKVLEHLVDTTPRASSDGSWGSPENRPDLVPQSAALPAKTSELRAEAEKYVGGSRPLELQARADRVRTQSESIFDPHLGRQLRSLPTLAFVTLSDVQQQLEEMVNFVLTTATLRDLGEGKTFGEFLVDCYRLRHEEIADEKEAWGMPVLGADEFALEFSPFPDTLVAGSRQNEILCRLFDVTCNG